ncbi:MAG: RNA polymerase sigma factor [Lachnospiraceae bacterium]|nr:RNA polymerase sigma factor [Lachnospiraceae bacterium]
MSNNEWKLVGMAKNGDAHAFALLYQKYYTDLYRFAFCLMKGSQSAEDAVSSAILKAYENLGRLRKNDSFKSWLFQITANECRNFLKHSPVYLEDSSYQEPYENETGYLNPEIQEMLSLLSDDERLIITLSVFSGYNSREIARLLHKKEGTVRSLKSRSLAKLRDHMEQ